MNTRKRARLWSGKPPFDPISGEITNGGAGAPRKHYFGPPHVEVFPEADYVDLAANLLPTRPGACLVVFFREHYYCLPERVWARGRAGDGCLLDDGLLFFRGGEGESFMDVSRYRNGTPRQVLRMESRRDQSA